MRLTPWFSKYDCLQRRWLEENETASAPAAAIGFADGEWRGDVNIGNGVNTILIGPCASMRDAMKTCDYILSGYLLGDSTRDDDMVEEVRDATRCETCDGHGNYYAGEDVYLPCPSCGPDDDAETLLPELE